MFEKPADLAIWIMLAAATPWLLFSQDQNPLEVAGFVTGAACVWLVVRENVLNFPIGLANSAIYIWVFYLSGLYGEMCLQFLYIALGIFGWYWWLHGGRNRTELTVSRTSGRHATIILAAAAVGLAGVYFLLSKTNNPAPFLDALTAVMCLAAQYMLTRKLIENWFVWITADVLLIGLFYSRGLKLTALLYVIYLSMCIAGYMQWSRAPKRAAAPVPA